MGSDPIDEGSINSELTEPLFIEEEEQEDLQDNTIHPLDLLERLQTLLTGRQAIVLNGEITLFI